MKIYKFNNSDYISADWCGVCCLRKGKAGTDAHAMRRLAAGDGGQRRPKAASNANARGYFRDELFGFGCFGFAGGDGEGSCHFAAVGGDE